MKYYEDCKPQSNHTRIMCHAVACKCNDVIILAEVLTRKRTGIWV